VNTCDKRSTKTILAEEYPAFDFHEPFDDEDILWVPDYREREPEMILRLGVAFKKIFDQEWDKSLCKFKTRVSRVLRLSGMFEDVSITAHSGAIRAMCRVLGHPTVAIPTGGLYFPLISSFSQLCLRNTSGCGESHQDGG
jgi:hypothetical protein